MSNSVSTETSVRYCKLLFSSMDEIETGVEELPVASSPLGVNSMIDGPADISLKDVLSVPPDVREKW